MSPIAEISLSQMQVMQDVYAYMPTFLMGLPKEDDDKTVKDMLYLTNTEIYQLVDLGLLEDITSKFQSMITDLEDKNKRQHKLFQITNVGRKFFEASASQIQN